MGGNEENEGAKQAFQACQGFQGCYEREGRGRGKIAYQAFQGCWGFQGSPNWDGGRGHLKDIGMLAIASEGFQGSVGC